MGKISPQETSKWKVETGKWVSGFLLQGRDRTETHTPHRSPYSTYSRQNLPFIQSLRHLHIGRPPFFVLSVQHHPISSNGRVPRFLKPCPTMGSCCQSKSQGETSPTPDSTKSRRSKKTSEAKSAKQSFNGKTYACISCKNGHRVRQCDHGYDRPVSATNQPGRPSSGSKRKCTCPKDCSCHDKDNCKCERNCVCVEAMYLIVHVSKKGSPKIQHKVSKIERSPSPIISRVNEKGQQEVLQKVYTDLTGKPLSDEETKRRNEEREKREQIEQDQKNAVKAESSTSTPFEFQIHQPTPSLLSPTAAPASGTLTPTWNVSSPSCCQHANNTQTPYQIAGLPSTHSFSTDL